MHSRGGWGEHGSMFSWETSYSVLSLFPPPQLWMLARNKFVVAINFVFSQFMPLIVGVRFRKASPHRVAHAQKAKHLPAQFPGISKAIIWVRRKVKSIKNESCRGTCWRETLLCHYSGWLLFRGEAFVKRWQEFQFNNASFYPLCLFLIRSAGFYKQETATKSFAQTLR